MDLQNEHKNCEQLEKVEWQSGEVAADGSGGRSEGDQSPQKGGGAGRGNFSVVLALIFP